MKGKAIRVVMVLFFFCFIICCPVSFKGERMVFCFFFVLSFVVRYRVRVREWFYFFFLFYYYYFFF